MLSDAGFNRVEPRCKVCMSPHRRLIDAMLATGWSQAEVRRHWNEFLRVAAFTANNLSAHARLHLNPRDPALASIRQGCVDLFLEEAQQGYEPGFALSERIKSAAELLSSFGLQAVHAGLVEVEPADLLRAIRLSQQLDEGAIAAARAQLKRERAELLQDFSLFAEAVKSFVPEPEWGRLLASFDELLATSDRPNRSP